MNCKRYEQWTALHAEGDLPQVDVPRLIEHLAQCSKCRDFKRDLLESQQAIKNLGNEGIDSLVTKQLRSKVLASIPEETEDVSWYTSHTRLAVVALACVLVIIVSASLFSLQRSDLLNTTSTGHTDIARNGKEKIIEEGSSDLDNFENSSQSEEGELRLVSSTDEETPSPPVVIKMLTNNPNVVIYWLGSEKEKDNDEAYI